MSSGSETVLLTWLGRTDLDCAAAKRDELGPIASALKSMPFDRICLLWNYAPEDVQPYLAWLGEHFPELAVDDRQITLSSPTNYSEIYRAAIDVVNGYKASDPAPALSFHLSPGTPAMQAVWIIIGKTHARARLIESSREAGVRVADIPFDLAADFKPDRAVLTGALADRAEATPDAAAFEAIVGSSDVLREAMARAQLAATQDFPVVILGESGTGKELFARAIHGASHRKEGPFVGINCGAIPENLLESELFGHEKGAFTGANARRAGCMERANGGTLFLDELGELPMPAQVSLLRALQEKRVVRVGGNEEIPVDIRIVAATNRDLPKMIRDGEFRSDLFYRLAVVQLNLPPLRERGEDLTALANHLLDRINQECERLGTWERKKISASAINVIKSHPWHGNVRELDNTLRRAAIWSSQPQISGPDLEQSLTHVESPGNGILDRPIGADFSLDATIAEVAKHYLKSALAQAHGNKSNAARLLGLNSHQTLSNKLKKHGIE